MMQNITPSSWFISLFSCFLNHIFLQTQDVLATRSLMTRSDEYMVLALKRAGWPPAEPWLTHTRPKHSPLTSSADHKPALINRPIAQQIYSVPL